MQRQLRELHAIEKEILERRNIEEQIYKKQMEENLKHEQRLRLQMRKPTPYVRASSPKKTRSPQNITLSIKERESNINEQDILNIEDDMDLQQPDYIIEKPEVLSYEGDLSER